MQRSVRDFVGYGPNPPDPEWPGGARIALQFVLNYEEGAESSVLDGDAAAESINSDMVGVSPWVGRRNLVMESHYEYGSRVGVWNLLELFATREIPVTVFAVGLALERNPAVARAFVEAGHEIAAHGWRWIDYRNCPPAVERRHIANTIESIERLTGSRPLGWYTGRISPNTRRLVVEAGCFLYDSDAYNDDLPYYVYVAGRDHLVLPYSFDTNDMRFASAPGFDTGEDFYRYLRDSFDMAYRLGAKRPRMMSVGLHCRLAGRPGRLLALESFLDHVAGHEAVWIARRVDIARHWEAHHPTTATDS